MRMTGVGISSASRTKLPIHMQTGSRTMMILDLERSGKRLNSTTKCTNHVTSCCLSMGPEGGADWVRLLGYCGYGMNMDPLRKSLIVCAEERLSEDS